MNSMMKMIVQMLVTRFLRDRMRIGGLKAARFYILIVQQLRTAAIMVSAMVAFIATAVLGFGFIIGGAIAALPIAAHTLPYVFIGVGSVFVLIVAVGLRVALNEQRWLEASQAYAFMNKIMSTFPEHGPGAQEQSQSQAEGAAPTTASKPKASFEYEIREESPRRLRTPRDEVDRMDLPLQPQPV